MTSPPHSPPMTENRRIDRNWNDHGRVRISVNTLSPDVIKGLGTMLSHLRRTGNVGLWTALSRKELDPLMLLAKYEANELDGVIAVERVRPAKEVMLEWASELPKVTTRKSYREAINNLFRNSPNATISEIPEVLRNRAAHYKAHGQKRTFEDCRKVASSWAGKTYTKDSPLWRAIRAVKPDIATTHVHKGKAREVWEVVSACKAMPKPFGAQFFTMCLLGMNTREYLVDGFTIVDEHYAVVHGKKNAARERKVPLIFDSTTYVKPSVTYANRKVLDQALHSVQPDWILSDSRRSFIHWMNEAGISVTRNKAYVGHDAGSINEGYRKHDVEPHLVSDAERLRVYIEANKKPPKVAKKVKRPTFTGLDF